MATAKAKNRTSHRKKMRHRYDGPDAPIRPGGKLSRIIRRLEARGGATAEDRRMTHHQEHAQMEALELVQPPNLPVWAVAPFGSGALAITIADVVGPFTRHGSPPVQLQQRRPSVDPSAGA